MDFESYSAVHRPKVEARLGELLPSAATEPQRLHEAMRYATLDAGKRFRPLICLAACEAVGGQLNHALDAACAVEMVHCFSLIHDDLPALDNDSLRRGKPTCHVMYGEAIAILAGDALFCKAFEVLSNIACEPSISLATLRVLAESTGTQGMVGGQTADIESEGSVASVSRVEWIHTRKTGALIAAATKIGALCGGGTPMQIENCGHIGELVGLGFQIADDILNQTGEATAIGKPAGTDVELKKATYPAVLGLEESRAHLVNIGSQIEVEITALGHGAAALAAVCRHGLKRQF